MNALFSLAGRTALVTGSSRGIGFAMAEGLAGAGAHVVLNGREPASLAARARELSDAGLKASFAAFDALDEAAARNAIAAIERDHGSLDILVANAGTNVRKPVLEMTTEEWRRVLDVDLTACFTLARDAAKGMVRRGWGRIIFTGSILSVLGRPTVPAYVAAKHGVAGLTRSMGAELGRLGVTVNAIGPGYIRTEMTRPLTEDRAFCEWLVARTPMGRWGEPREIAGAAVFLASDAASYVNGHLLMVDGGHTTNA